MIDFEKAIQLVKNNGGFSPNKKDSSFYRTYKVQGSKPLQVRVSNHGTHLWTWYDKAYDPSHAINFSIVYSKDGTYETDTSVDMKIKDKNGNVVGERRSFEVIQYIYNCQMLDDNDAIHINQNILNIWRTKSFTDPLANTSKHAKVVMLRPNEPIQIIKESKTTNKNAIKLTESKLRNMIKEATRRSLEYFKNSPMSFEDALQRLRNGENPERLFSCRRTENDGNRVISFSHKFNLLNSSNQLMSDVWFDSISPLDIDGCRTVSLNGKRNLINRDGEIVMPKWVDDIWKNDKYGRICVLNHKRFRIDVKDGKVLYRGGDVPTNENNQHNNRNMKQTIRLTESELNRIIRRYINEAVNEIGDTPKGQYMLGRVKTRANRRQQYDVANDASNIDKDNFGQKRYCGGGYYSFNSPEFQKGANDQDRLMNTVSEAKMQNIIHRCIREAVNEIGDTERGQEMLGRLARRHEDNDKNATKSWEIEDYAQQQRKANRGIFGNKEKKLNRAFYKGWDGQ